MEQIKGNIISFYIIDKNTYEIKLYIKLEENNLNEDMQLDNFLKKFTKVNSHSINKKYEFRTIYISSIVIQFFFNNNSNNVFVCLFNKKEGIFPIKLFLLHMYTSYKNINLKLSKYLENNENYFNLVFKEIFLIPLIHNFDNIYKKLQKKIDLILFGNSEYITSMMIDLETNKVLCDLGNLLQKNYKSSFLQIKNKKHILEEIIYHGKNLKKEYLKSNDKNIDKNRNCLKLELRATFPKPLYIIKFIPILQGVVIVHYFSQYKLSKSQIRNPNNPNVFIYDNYREIDIGFFNLFEQFEENNAEQIKNIEKYFFEYFLLLGNNCKEIGNVSSNLMTYKNRDYNLIYLNKDIFNFIKEIIKEYFKDEKELIFKLKKKLFEENEKIENNVSTYKNELIQDNLNKNNQMEFTYMDFIKEFKKNRDLLGVNDITIIMPGEMNEHSELTFTVDNISAIKRNIVSNNNLDNGLNIYNNYYRFITTDNKSQITEIENDNNTNQPFNIDVTNIINNVEVSKDESGFKSILADRNKQKK